MKKYTMDGIAIILKTKREYFSRIFDKENPYLFDCMKIGAVISELDDLEKPLLKLCKKNAKTVKKVKLVYPESKMWIRQKTFVEDGHKFHQKYGLSFEDLERIFFDILDVEDKLFKRYEVDLEKELENRKLSLGDYDFLAKRRINIISNEKKGS